MMAFFWWIIGILTVMAGVYLLEWVIDFWITWPFEE